MALLTVSAPEVLAIIVGVILSYALVGWLVYKLSHFVMVTIYVLRCWGFGETITEMGMKRAWRGFEDRDSSWHDTGHFFSFIWPVGAVAMCIGLPLDIITAIIRRVKRYKVSVKMPKLNLRPSWWNLSKLVSILNRVFK